MPFYCVPGIPGTNHVMIVYNQKLVDTFAENATKAYMRRVRAEIAAGKPKPEDTKEEKRF